MEKRGENIRSMILFPGCDRKLKKFHKLFFYKIQVVHQKRINYLIRINK